MGNWRRVQVTGSCDTAEVPALRGILALDYNDPRWGPLHCGGLCGLPNWAAEQIAAVGNLGERNFTPEDVAQTAAKLSMVAPSLSLLIHCGGDYEADECVATVRLSHGRAWVIEPKVETIPQLDADVMRSNLVLELQKRA